MTENQYQLRINQLEKKIVTLKKQLRAERTKYQQLATRTQELIDTINRKRL